MDDSSFIQLTNPFDLEIVSDTKILKKTYIKTRWPDYYQFTVPNVAYSDSITYGKSGTLYVNTGIIIYGFEFINNLIK